MNRTKKSIKNLYTAIIGQAAGIIISFISRIFFVRTLGAEFLGINGLFTNVLQMLSLVELGVGPAIIYTLYKPLAEKDTEKVSTIMKLYKKIYIIIGSIIIILGLIITPFITYFIDDVSNISINIYIVFILFVLNSGISYFFSYKRNLIIADQNRYIATIYRYLFYFILNVGQIILLIITKNYYLYLFLQIIFTFSENIFISIKANKLYPYLKEKNIKKLDKDTKDIIVKNTKAMIFHKVGGLVVNSTDNILISKIVNIASVGLYSNYFMITNALNTIISQFFSSISASVGNVNAVESKEKSLEVFKKVNFINFWIISFSSICFMCLANDFITLWLGKDMSFSFDVVIILTICFYLSGMRKTILTFRDTFGLYWKDRYKPVFEIIINLLVSIYLGKKIGVVGIFIGTAVSTITTCLWTEPYILYKYGFNKKMKGYFIDYIKYFIFTLFVSIIMIYLLTMIKISGITGLIIKSFLCLIIPNLFIVLIFHKREEYKYCINLVKKILRKIKKKGK